LPGAYKASCLSKDARKRVDNFNYGAKEIDQLVIFFPIVFERRLSFQKYSDDIFWRMTMLEFICGGMFRDVYSGLRGIAEKCGIEDGLKVGRGRGC